MNTVFLQTTIIVILMVVATAGDITARDLFIAMLGVLAARAVSVSMTVIVE